MTGLAKEIAGRPLRVARTRRLRRFLRTRLLWLLLLGALTLAFALMLTVRFAGQVLVVETPPLNHVDAVLVLAGAVPDRALEASRLVQAGVTSLVLLGNDPLSPEAIRLQQAGLPIYSHGQMNQKILVRQEVPEQEIHLLSRYSNSTWEDAMALREYIQKHPLRSVAIVTCRYHTLRSRLNFQRALKGLDTRVFVMPAADCSFNALTWWRSRSDAWHVVQEWLKLVAYFLGFR